LFPVKALLVVFLILCVLLGAVVGLLWWRPWSLVRIQTTVRVTEGVVDLYSLDGRGERVFKRTVTQGQTARMTALHHTGRGSEFGLFGPLLSDTLVSFMAQVESLAQRLPEETFSRMYTEAQFTELILRKLQGRIPVKSLRVTIDRNGFTADGRLEHGPLALDVSGSGIVDVNKDYKNLLYLRIYRIKIGPMDCPDLITSRLEDTFAEIVSRKDFPIEILDMKYQDKGILITARRRQR